MKTLIFDIEELYEKILDYGPHGKNDDLVIKYLLKTYPADYKNEEDVPYWGKRSNKRWSFIYNYSWAVPSKIAIRSIEKFVKNDRIIEVSAGYGLWAKLISDIGIEIIATDIINEEDGKRFHYIPENIQYINMEQLDYLSALKKYNNFEVLMMLWPIYDDSLAYNSLKEFKGDKFIYIGETQGGCNGDNKFFNLLDKEWEEVEMIIIPQWYGIHDYLCLYERKNNPNLMEI